MKIQSFRINNFKSFADSGVANLGAINILIGRNNSGKSAIIRALSLLQTGNDVTPADIRIGTAQAELHLVLSGPFEPHWGSINMGSPAGMVVRFSSSRVELTMEGRIGLAQLSKQEPHNFIYPYLSKRKVVAFDPVIDRSKTTLVENDLRYLVSKVARLANIDHPLAGEYEALCKEVFGFRISTFASPDGQRAGIPVGKTDYIPVEAMGEGVSSLLGLITELCMADGHLFLLEEPENDIHPEALKAILRAIVARSAANQFVISTHSNVVVRHLGSVKDSRLFAVTMSHTAGQLPTSTVEAISATAEARMAVLQQLGYELYDFDLWDGWLILEESSAERVIRDHLIPWFAPKLARIRAVAANGIDQVERTMNDFNRLFLFLHLESVYKERAWVVVDGGPKGEAVAANLRQQFQSWPAQHFSTWKKHDFEEYYPNRFSADVGSALSQSHDAKRIAKRTLLKKVLEWCNTEPETAKAEFELSAAEIIARLRDIQRKLFGT